ncbi:VWA domain-containing protein [Oleiharenicola lentus]|uniref:VWA domain-containing protein n=1 Tax=Oleiharenicola lentus TaxID=2508720 RepID=UPI003F67C4AA
MNTWTFQNPWWLFGCVVLIGVGIARYWRRLPVLVIPSAMEWNRTTGLRRTGWLTWAVYSGLALMFGALARPQFIEHKKEEKKPGYDIMLAIDLSTSMYAEDFQRDGAVVNRLQAIKPVIEAFINQRPDDRIGIVLFASRAHTFAPLTFDHDWLRKQTGRISIGLIEDGTAIGDAIGVGLSRLKQGRKNKDSPARLGAFLVVLTDGASNRGALEPRQAAELAAEEGVTIFTVGAGAEGRVPMPVFDYTGKRTGTEMRESEVDTLLLRDIADKTGGYFFRATDSDAIQAAFAGINAATKVEFDAPPLEIVHDLFAWFLTPAVFLIGLVVCAAARRDSAEVFA